MRCKLTVVTLVFLYAGLAAAQGINISFAPEGVQTASENTELLLSDPTVNQTTYFVSPVLDQKRKDETGAESSSGGDLGGLSIGIESEISGPNKSVSIPLNYSWKRFSFGASIPYIFQRKMQYTQSTVEASGIGDISANVGYSGGGDAFSFSANVFAKFPTGDDEKMVDGMLVPLGTGSTDLIFNLSAMKVFTKFSLFASGTYRMNGSSEKIAEVTYADDQDGDPATTDIETINYTITNGDMIAFTGRFDYALGSKWTLGAAAALTIVGEGETDAEHTFNWDEPDYTVSGASNYQDMTLVDLTPMLSYYLWAADLTVMAKIPLVTERNEYNNEGDRDITFMFKLSRTL